MRAAHRSRAQAFRGAELYKSLADAGELRTLLHRMARARLDPFPIKNRSTKLGSLPSWPSSSARTRRSRHSSTGAIAGVATATAPQLALCLQQQRQQHAPERQTVPNGHCGCWCKLEYSRRAVIALWQPCLSSARGRLAWGATSAGPPTTHVTVEHCRTFL